MNANPVCMAGSAAADNPDSIRVAVFKMGFLLLGPKSK